MGGRELLYYSWTLPLAVFLFSQGPWFSSASQRIAPLERTSRFAKRVVSKTPGVRQEDRAIGTPSFPMCVSCYSELRQGELVLDFGEMPQESPPKSLVVWALDPKYRGVPTASPGLRVSVSSDLRDWIDVGIAHGITTFDRPGGTVRYVRLAGMPVVPSNRARVDAVELVY